MTLKERFKQWLDTDPRLQIREVQLEVIAEDFTIKFVDWLFTKDIYIIQRDYTLKELLEIYKKEKGL